MAYFDNATLYSIFPELRDVPVVKFRNGNLYFLLDVKHYGGRTANVELMQMDFDSRAGELLPLPPFKQEEEVTILPDGKPWLKRFSRVDWRFEEPEKIVSLQKLLPHVCTLRQKQATQRITARFSSDNVHEYARKHVIIGAATTPSNPEIQMDPKPSMVVSKKL